MLAYVVENGGIIFWIIVAMGVFGFLVFLERSLSLHRSRIDVTDFLHGIFNIVKRGNHTEALTLCSETPGPVAKLTAVAIPNRNISRDFMIDLLEDVGSTEIARLERRLSIVALVAQITPMMGLLGTVVGVFTSLTGISENSPMVSSTDITSGLIQACITTIAGLVVAIPCFIGFHILITKIDRLSSDMRHACSELVSFFCMTEEAKKNDVESESNTSEVVGE